MGKSNVKSRRERRRALKAREREDERARFMRVYIEQIGLRCLGDNPGHEPHDVADAAELVVEDNSWEELHVLCVAHSDALRKQREAEVQRELFREREEHERQIAELNERHYAMKYDGKRYRK